VTQRSGVAVIGAGSWGQNLVRSFHELGALVAICEVDPARRESLAARYPTVRTASDVEAVLGDPEVCAVAIATPALSHADLAERALLAGKDVFVEKPLSLSVPSGERLVDIARRSDRILMVGHVLRYPRRLSSSSS
jgi:UDP-2-acetamido-3-amino-2,3-dideoxy-glucuronate N-acetyltransferase